MNIKLRNMALAVLFGLATALPAAAQDHLKLKVGYDGLSMTTLPMQYAEKNGIFAKHGIDVEQIFVRGGSVLTQAVIGGDVDIGQNGYSSSMAAAVQGADIKIIGGISNLLPFVVIGQPDIKSFADLKGKTIAISRFGSSTHTAAKMAMEHFGMKPEDITILQLGGEADRNAAFLSGQVAANVLQYPLAQDRIDEGANLLLELTNIAKEYPNTAYVSTEKFLASPEHKEAVKRYFEALAEAIKAVHDNPEDAAKITADFLQVNETPNLIKTVKYYSNGVYAKDLRPTLPGMQQVLDELAVEDPKAADFKPEDMVDTSILDELDSEGFFSKLNG